MGKQENPYEINNRENSSCWPVIELGDNGFFKIDVEHLKSIGYQRINLEQAADEPPGTVKVSVEFLAVMGDPKK